jgi:hypothetical protein
MLRLRLLFFAALLLLAVHPLMADNNFVVGTCKPRLHSFTTISAAVSSVPPGSTILVCPGTYAEQVVIAQPLTLQGIASANQDQAVIAVPGAGLAANVTSAFAQAVAAQVLVQTPGPVNISNITVDGTGGDLGCSAGTWVAGILYASGSSGAVSRVKVSGQTDGGCGVGVWAENGDGSNQFVSVENSSVHDMDGEGIFAANSSTSGLNVSIRNNVVSPNAAGLIGIILANVGGIVAGNDVSNAMFGIANLGPGPSISSNTVSLANAGIVLEGGGTVTSNRISSSSFGIWFFADGGNVQSNRITSTSVAGIEFNCHAGYVTHNTVNDAVVGFDQVASNVSESNNFANTGTVSTGGCASAAVRASAARTTSHSAALAGGSISQWRTPATPFGLLK